MTTHYVAIVGPRTGWPGLKSLKYEDFKDGLDWTILLIEDHSEIPWTEPRDLSLEEAVDALAKTNRESFHHRSESFFSKTFHGPTMLLGDGRVFSAPLGMDQTLAAELLAIDDGKPAYVRDLTDAGRVSATQIKWRNVILVASVIFLTLLPLPWVWIHPHGVKISAATVPPNSDMRLPGERGA